MWFCCQIIQCNVKSCFGPIDVWKTWHGWSHVVHPSNSTATSKNFGDGNFSDECARRHKNQLPRHVVLPSFAPNCSVNSEDNVYGGNPQIAVDIRHGYLNEREAHSTCGHGPSGSRSACRSTPSCGASTSRNRQSSAAGCSSSRCSARSGNNGRRDSRRVPVLPLPSPLPPAPVPADSYDLTPPSSPTKTLLLDSPRCTLNSPRRTLHQCATHTRKLSSPTKYENTAAANMCLVPSDYFQNIPQQELGLDAATEYPSERSSTPLSRTPNDEWSILGNNLDFWRMHHMRECLESSKNLSEPDLRNSKVRYNDPGSLEEVNMGSMLDYAAATEGSRLKAEAQLAVLRLQYKELWELRTTLEQKERSRLTMTNFSEQDEGRSLLAICENTEQSTPSRSSAEQSPVRDPGTSHTTSVESLPVAEVTRSLPDLLQPPSTYESRRETYKSLLSDRQLRTQENTQLQRQPVTSDNNSFDSLDTVNTEGSSTTDASRFEQATTSFESITDNTDSTSDAPQQHKLHQTRADSGYRSFETPAAVAASRAPKLQRRSQFQLPESYEMEELATPTEQDSEDADNGIGRIMSPPYRHAVASTSASNVWDYTKRSVNYNRTASKKRLEFGRDRRSEEPSSYFESVNEMETYSHHDSTENLDEVCTMISCIPGNGSYNPHGTATTNFSTRSAKAMILPRYMRHGSRYNSMYVTPQRDYSVDEKSDALFREFSRCDPKYEPAELNRQRFHHRRVHRGSCNTELEMVHQRRSKLSPQDSIDEELTHRRTQVKIDPEQQTVTEIPIIRVAHEDDSSEIDV